MIVVFGSVNVDFVTRVPAIPRPGETILGPSYAVAPGGKGANQALAARLAGEDVALVAAVGADPFAEVALAGLARAGVDLSAVARLEAPTGAAFIAVDAAGENAIVVAAGANASLRAEALLARGIAPGDLLVLQREVDVGETRKAAAFARSRGASVLLNLAPARDFVAADLARGDILVVNEHEADYAARALGLAPGDPEASARALARTHGATCVVTLGAQGALAAGGAAFERARAPKVEVVDTTGAGDCFVGALAAEVARGAPLGAALRFAVAAGALACTAPGAQSGLPNRAAIEALTAAG